MVSSTTAVAQFTAQSFENVKKTRAQFDPAPLFLESSLVDPSNVTWSIESDENLLVVSPYRSVEHLLDLRTLQTNQQLLAKALTALQAIRPDYATCSYSAAFNWSVVINELRFLIRQSDYSWADQHFYIVVFRSQIPPTTDRVHLTELDSASHVEATKSGGLLKYWFGVPDGEGRNLATCVWRRQADARPGSAGAGHKAAMRATMSMYTEWKVERLKLVIRGDGSGGVGDWNIANWEEKDG